MEVVVAVATSIAMVSFAASMFGNVNEDAKLKKTLNDGEYVLKKVETYRLSITGDTVDGSGVAQYTYASYPEGTTIADFNDDTGMSLPETSDFGTPYTIDVGNYPAVVIVNVPIAGFEHYKHDTRAGATPGTTDVIMMATPGLHDGGLWNTKTIEARHNKRVYYGETTTR